MGAALVAVATMKWSHVGDEAFRVLVRMAVVAHDRESASAPARQYFGGHDGLTDVLGRDGYSAATKRRRVREAIAELEQRGAIRCVRAAVSGRNAVYELTLDAVPMAAKPPRVRSKAFARQEAHSAPTGAAERAPTREAHSAPTEGAHCAPTPYMEEELVEDSLEERFEDVRARSSGPPALRVVVGSGENTSEFVQPSIWPAPVPTPGELAVAHVRRLLEDRKRGRASA